MSNTPKKTKEQKSVELVEPERLSFWQTLQSVMFAMVGVQSAKNAKRDMSKGRASHFIALGIVFGILFVLSVALVVTLVLELATT